MTLKLYYLYFGTMGHWHQLPDYALQVSQTGFMFRANNFMFHPFDEMTQWLTTTGVMNFIVKKCFKNKAGYIEKGKWTVLMLRNLEFGFVIWLGCCGICCVVFAGELLYAQFVNGFKRH